MAEKSPIHLDISDVLIVIYCDDHPWWRACRFTLDAARDAACGHEERAHGDDRRQRMARYVRAHRERARAADTPV